MSSGILEYVLRSIWTHCNRNQYTWCTRNQSELIGLMANHFRECSLITGWGGRHFFDSTPSKIFDPPSPGAKKFPTPLSRGQKIYDPLSIHVYVLYMSLTILIHVYVYKDISFWRMTNPLIKLGKILGWKMTMPLINLESTYKGEWVHGAWWVPIYDWREVPKIFNWYQCFIFPKYLGSFTFD